MKKSVRIHLLVSTTVVALFVFAGIWYLRPGVSSELLEQAQARQLQPLLEIEEPLRRPKVESVSTSATDKKALADELLPSLTDQVSRSLESSLYEKLKQDFVADEAFMTKISSHVAQRISEDRRGAAEIPPSLQGDFARQLEALRTELFATFGEGQTSFFYQIEGMVDTRLQRMEQDLTATMQAYVPQVVDGMIPALVEMLVHEFDTNKQMYLPYLAEELKPYIVTEDEVLALYSSYRDLLILDLAPSLLTEMEGPAREKVASMVEGLGTAAVTPTPATPTITKPTVKTETVALTEEVESVPEVPALDPATVQEILVPEVPTVVSVPEPLVPQAPSIFTVQKTEIKPEPIIKAPVFAPSASGVFMDPETYEEKRTEIRTKAIQEVLDRINAL